MYIIISTMTELKQRHCDLASPRVSNCIEVSASVDCPVMTMNLVPGASKTQFKSQADPERAEGAGAPKPFHEKFLCIVFRGK